MSFAVAFWTTLWVAAAAVVVVVLVVRAVLFVWERIDALAVRDDEAARARRAAASVLVVGGGFGGLAVARELQRRGVRFTLVERQRDYGGTWLANRYPGVGCDLASHLYSFSWAPNAEWRRYYASGADIQRYTQRVAHDVLALARVTEFGTEVVSARWQRDAARWRVELRDVASGAARVRHYQAVVWCVGQLSHARVPRVDGAAQFAGRAFHTTQWPVDDDARGTLLAGKRVVVVGSGATTIQLVPALATRGDGAAPRHITVLQRTPSHVAEKPDAPVHAVVRAAFRHVPGALYAFRCYLYWWYERLWPTWIMSNKWLRAMASAELVDKTLLRAVPDEHRRRAVERAVTPAYPLGCKRILISNEYLQLVAARPELAERRTDDDDDGGGGGDSSGASASRPCTVELIDSALARVTPHGVVAVDGRTRRADVIIYATGFTTTSFLAPAAVYRDNGTDTPPMWRTRDDVPVALHGVCPARAPNMYVLYGPNTNLSHNSIIFMLEAQARYAAACVAHVVSRGERAAIVARDDVVARYDGAQQSAIARTAWLAADCHSWYYSPEHRRVTNNLGSSTLYYWWQTMWPRRADFVDVASPSS